MTNLKFYKRYKTDMKLKMMCGTHTPYGFRELKGRHGLYSRGHSVRFWAPVGFAC